MDFWTIIVSALGIGIAILIIAFFVAVAYMIVETARQSLNKNKGDK